MRILLTNDDGFDAPGIQALYEVLSTDHEVWIVAPDGNKSGYSCSLSMFRDMELTQRGTNLYALAGSPVDCVLLAHMTDILPGRPDVVISGINNGANMGRDVIYSGTCGAAREASLCGTPGIAMSLEKLDWSSKEPYLFREMAEFVRNNLERLIGLAGSRIDRPGSEKSGSEAIGYPYFVNVNAPSVRKYQGVKFASLCHKIYWDKIIISEDEDGKKKSRLEIVGADSWGTMDNDEKIVHDGYVSVSIVPSEYEAAKPSNLEESGCFIV